MATSRINQHNVGNAFRDTHYCELGVHSMFDLILAPRHAHHSRSLEPGQATVVSKQRLVGTPARQQGCMSKSMGWVGKLDLRRHALIGLASLAHVRPGEMPDRHVSRGRCSLCTYRICHLSCSVAFLLVQPTPGQKCARRSQCNIDRYCAAARRLTLERLGLKERASSGLM